jgi:hypothetical protein
LCHNPVTLWFLMNICISDILTNTEQSSMVFLQDLQNKYPNEVQSTDLTYLGVVFSTTCTITGHLVWSRLTALFFAVLPCQRFCSFVNVFLCVALLLVFFCQNCSFTRNSRILVYSPLLLYSRSKWFYWRVKALTEVHNVWSAIALQIQNVTSVNAFTIQ